MFDSKWVVKNKQSRNEDLVSCFFSARNISDKKAYLEADIKDLYDPFLINDMTKAAERIKIAVDNKEKICIYGDYDADGITSAAILLRFFKEININAEYFIPDRFDDGYGLNIESLKRVVDKGVQLVITTDCGINSINETEFLLKNGIDIIITDHHQSMGELPKATAVICCTRPDNTYPYLNLSGAGIAYKLSEACKKFMSINTDSRLAIALAALGTVADVVNLDGENRIIVKNGLEIIREGICSGLEALLEIAAVNKKFTDANTLGFIIGPRINAAGRMGEAESALKLLMTDDYNLSRNTAIVLDRLNNKRKSEQDRIFNNIIEKFAEYPEIYKAPVIVMEGEDYSKGVIGIVAAKISEIYNKPAIILSVSNGLAEGSGRSNGNFSLIKGLEYCKSILLKFGGHDNAAGLALNTNDINQFRSAICEFAVKNGFEHAGPYIIEIDSETKADIISFFEVENLKILEPFGYGNAEPVWELKKAELKDYQAMGSNKQHLKFTFKCGESLFKAVSFNSSAYIPLFYVGEFYDIACNTTINEYKDYRTLQLMIKDIKISSNNEPNLDYLIVRILIHMIKYEKNDRDKITMKDLSGYLYKIGMPGSAENLSDNYELFMVERNNIAEVYNNLKTLKANDVFDIRNIVSSMRLTAKIISIEILSELGIFNVVPTGIYTYIITGNREKDKKNLEESLIYRIFSKKEVKYGQ